jgi:hypothetical protein
VSDYHVKYMSRRDQLEVVFHFDVPDQSNFAGVNLRTAVSDYLAQSGTITSDYPGIDGVELGSLQAGIKYEETHTVVFDGKLTDAQKRDQVDAFWTARNSKFQTEVLKRLNFWGYNREVP